MTDRGLAMGWILLSVLGVGVGLRTLDQPVADLPTPRPPRRAPVVEDRGPRLFAESLAVFVGTRDMFRLARHPSPVRYDPLRRTLFTTASPAKPTLVCTGIVWEEDSPSAVVIGLPGTTGPRVVQLGDRISGFVIRGIAPDRVIVAGLDTTWTLAVHEPWQ